MPSSHTAVTFTLSRDVDGTISGGPSGLSAGDVPLLFRSGIDVLGGTLWFDVRRSEPLPFVEITSAAAAAWWVEGVLGADPATTVAGWAPDHAEAIVDGADVDSAGGADFGADDFPDDPDIALLLAVDEVEEASASFDLDLRRVGASLVALRRLAMGHWLRRYWPGGDRTGFGHLDPLLMDCELATLAWSLDDILLTRQHAGPLLAPHAARLVDLVDDFYTEVEDWLTTTFDGSRAGLRVEWSKGWGYTPDGAWTSQASVSGTIPASLTVGQPAGTGFADAVAVLHALDPHRIYSSPLLDRLMP